MSHHDNTHTSPRNKGHNRINTVCANGIKMVYNMSNDTLSFIINENLVVAI